jgi:hypothetical protein
VTAGLAASGSPSDVHADSDSSDARRPGSADELDAPLATVQPAHHLAQAASRPRLPQVRRDSHLKRAAAVAAIVGEEAGHQGDGGAPRLDETPADEPVRRPGDVDDHQREVHALHHLERDVAAVDRHRDPLERSQLVQQMVGQHVVAGDHETDRTRCQCPHGDLPCKTRAGVPVHDGVCYDTLSSN